MKEREDQIKCECDGGFNRRDFLAVAGTAASGLTMTSLNAQAADDGGASTTPKNGALVRVAFLYPPSSTFANDPDGWWSWPGNEFDAERRQKEYMSTLHEIEQKCGMRMVIDPKPIANQQDAQRLAKDLQASRPDGLLLVMFYNRSLGDADLLLKTADELGIPAIFFIGLGVKHGSVTQYRRDGLYFIQSLDNLEAIEYGLRMVHTKKRMAQSKLLSVTEANEPREGTEKFFGTKVRVIPFSRYAKLFGQVSIDDQARKLIADFVGGATEVRKVSKEALENAARAHLALQRLLAEEQADGVTMNCLRRGMLKPCVSFATLNSQLIPAACENDFPAVYTQLLGQLLLGRPGFQHNPCFDTERNHYYGSHCTCPPRLYGPDGPPRPYLLRRFAHTNEGSCAIQVFWKEGDPVTMVRYHPGDPPALDVYAGQVVQSHAMPPAAGCTTNVEIRLTDRQDACQVSGHHNLIFCGDVARKFRLFAQLYKIKLAETGFQGPWPI